ncbi:hypothetical protein [Oceaniglobus ichthyenteri]|uniref:hypothetical protein n=1 Tax=Oceaniglobus ichthyenteri TaxID=2136177 RepID=UPI000D394186|nr:hypothetical protein [Oceaniglobus ichthyenteri]
MANRPTEPLFLERQTYRRRRLMDAARILPVAGFILCMLPMLWAGPGAADASVAVGGLYLFGVWTLLIVTAGILSRRLIRAAPPDSGTR